jgi:hypothetical protein
MSESDSFCAEPYAKSIRNDTFSHMTEAFPTGIKIMEHRTNRHRMAQDCRK